MRDESASSKTYSNEGKLDGKSKKIYIDCPRDQLKLTCLIHVPGHLSYECKVLNDFGTKHTKGRLFEKRMKEPTSNQFLE